MKKPLKKILISLFVVGVLIVLSILIYSYHVLKSPEEMTAVAEAQIQQNIGMPVQIAQARLDWKKGPRITLTSVNVESPGNLSLRIKKAYAYLSLWHLLFGDVHVSKVRLLAPRATINLDNWEKFKSEKGKAKRPTLLIWNGSLNILYKGNVFPLKEVNGRINADMVDLRARTLGGRINLEADLTKPGKTAMEAYDIHLDEFGKGYKGMLHMSLALDNESDKDITGSFLLEAKALNLPWARKKIDKITASVTASGSKDHLNLSDITLKSPLVSVSGKGELSGAMNSNSWPDARLSLDLSSSEFDYEQMVAMLPVSHFPDWLKTLLTSQIRQGRTRFSTARYKGPIKGFFNGVTLMDNMYVVEEYKGLSFGAGHSPDRATGLTGRVVYGSGDIVINVASGMIGKSRLGPITIAFPDAIRPLMRVVVDSNIDLPADDFLRLWKASVVPKEVYKILSPVSMVKSGHIQGHMITRYDEAIAKTPRFKGDLRMSNCSYTWGTHTILGQSGTIRSDGFSSPLRITMAAQMDKLRIPKLDMSLEDPFGKNRYRFTLVASHLPAVGKIGMENASLVLTGTGEGPNFKGGFDISTPGISISGIQYKPTSKNLSARGEVKASLWPETSFDLSAVNIHLGSGKLTGSAFIAEDSGTATINGDLQLKDITALAAKGPQKLDGSLSGTVNLAWNKVFTMDGELSLKDALFVYQDRQIVMNGPLVMKTSTISSPGLRINSGGTTVVLTGNLGLEKPFFYKGNVAVSHLKLGEEGNAPGLDMLKDMQADTVLTCTECDFYGVPVEHAKAQAQIKQGVLHLSHIEMEAISGGTKGDATIAIGGKSSFDFVVSIQNADMSKLLHAASPGKPWIGGEMNLEGHIFGNDGSINGSLTLNARNGEIRKYALISQIFSLLNVYKIIQTGDIDILSSRFSYNRLSSTFTIKDSVMTFDDFFLDSNSIQISAVGKYLLKEKKIDAVLGVQPLESVDRTLSMIPVLGWVLTGNKGKLIVVSMKAQGPIDDPKVQIAPIKTISNAITRPLLRTLRLPSHIYNEFMKIIGEK
jgi:hypothetical protein